MTEFALYAAGIAALAAVFVTLWLIAETSWFIARRKARRRPDGDDVGLAIFDHDGATEDWSPMADFAPPVIARSPLAGVRPPVLNTLQADYLNAVAERQAAWGETTGIFAGMVLNWSGTPLASVGPREVDIRHERRVWTGDGWRPEPVDAPLALNLRGVVRYGEVTA